MKTNKLTEIKKWNQLDAQYSAKQRTLYIGNRNGKSGILSHYKTQPELNASYNRELIEHIVFTKDIKLAEDATGMFANFNQLTSIEGLGHLDTHKTTSFRKMFANDSKLTDFDLTNFKTKHVIDTSSMFKNAKSITNLDLTNWNLNAVVTANSMFENMTNVEQIKFANNQFKHTINFAKMFNKDVNLRKVNTKAINNQDDLIDHGMDNMFSHTKVLRKIHLNNMNTFESKDNYDVLYDTPNLYHLTLGANVRLTHNSGLQDVYWQNCETNELMQSHQIIANPSKAKYRKGMAYRYVIDGKENNTIYFLKGVPEDQTLIPIPRNTKLLTGQPTKIKPMAKIVDIKVQSLVTTKVKYFDITSHHILSTHTYTTPPHSKLPVDEFETRRYELVDKKQQYTHSLNLDSSLQINIQRKPIPIEVNIIDTEGHLLNTTHRMHPYGKSINYQIPDGYHLSNPVQITADDKHHVNYIQVTPNSIAVKIEYFDESAHQLIKTKQLQVKPYHKLWLVDYDMNKYDSQATPYVVTKATNQNYQVKLIRKPISVFMTFQDEQHRVVGQVETMAKYNSDLNVNDYVPEQYEIDHAVKLHVNDDNQSMIINVVPKMTTMTINYKDPHQIVDCVRIDSQYGTHVNINQHVPKNYKLLIAHNDVKNHGQTTTISIVRKPSVGKMITQSMTKPIQKIRNGSNHKHGHLDVHSR